MNKIRIIIVDDHPIVREGLQAMFECRARFKVEACLDGGEAVLKWCREHGAPDVILSDVRMPGMDGFAMLAKMRRSFPGAKVLLLAGLPLKEEEARAREGGAKGYVSKSANTDALADAVQKIAFGIIPFVTDVFVPVPTPFTPKEAETLKWIAEGKTREEIAVIMGVAPETVKTFTRAVRDKLDAPNTAVAVSRAYELGYLRA